MARHAFRCRNCGALLKAPMQRVRQRSKCPKCGSLLTVPTAQQEAAYIQAKRAMKQQDAVREAVKRALTRDVAKAEKEKINALQQEAQDRRCQQCPEERHKALDGELQKTDRRPHEQPVPPREKPVSRSDPSAQGNAGGFRRGPSPFFPRSAVLTWRWSRLAGARSMQSNTRMILGITGSLVLVLGVFSPLISFPIVGSLDYFQNGHGDGVIILVLAGLSLLLSASRR